MAQRTKSARATRATKAGDETGVHVQRFTITYEYPVHFTDGLLRAGQSDPGAGASTPGARPPAPLHRVRRRRHHRRPARDHGRDHRLCGGAQQHDRAGGTADPGAGRRGDQERSLVRRADAGTAGRAPDRPAFLRHRDRRRRRAGCGRPGRRHDPSRHPADPRADHGAGAGRFRRRRQERRQPVWASRTWSAPSRRRSPC